MISPNDKEQALDRIADLAETYKLSLDEVSARLSQATQHQRSSIFTIVLAYIGVALVAVGVGAYIEQIWPDLSSFWRVAVTFGTGTLLLISGLASAKQTTLDRIGTPQLFCAAILQPGGMFVYLNEYYTGGSPTVGAMLVFGLLAIQMAVLFWWRRHSALLFFALVYSYLFLWALGDHQGVQPDWIALWIGSLGLAVNYRVSLTRHRFFVSPTYFLFAGLMFGSSWSLLVGHYPYELGLIALAGTAIYLSLLAQSRSLLAASVLALLAYLGYFTDKYLMTHVHGPLALILAGIATIGIGLGWFRLNQRLAKAREDKSNTV